MLAITTVMSMIISKAGSSICSMAVTFVLSLLLVCVTPPTFSMSTQCVSSTFMSVDEEGAKASVKSVKNSETLGWGPTRIKKPLNGLWELSSSVFAWLMGKEVLPRPSSDSGSPFNVRVKFWGASERSRSVSAVNPFLLR